MTLDEAKKYLRVDGDITDDDTLIQSSLIAAASYINGKTGKTKVKTGVDGEGLPIYGDITEDELYNLCLKMLLAHWYENRVPQIPGAYTNVDHSVDALITHISLCGDYI
jgi:uncharacterized phage protein (possible DNA packaging)